MEIFLLRHFESEKNIQNKMSYNDEEKLTLNGKRQCEEFSRLFKEFCEKRNIRIDQINAANSNRAKETANTIASFLGNLFVKSFSDLKSTNAGNLAGKSLDDIKKQDPFFSKHYDLYRKGLLNLYYLDENWHDEKKESKKHFEKKVLNCFKKIINDSTGKDVFIVAHRASISAILISIARDIGIYPRDFYGSVELSLGSISWLTLLKSKEWQINFINTKIEEII